MRCNHNERDNLNNTRSSHDNNDTTTTIDRTDPPDQWCQLWVRAVPAIVDPRELHTILQVSLSSLLGEWGLYHPYQVQLLDKTRLLPPLVSNINSSVESSNQKQKRKRLRQAKVLLDLDDHDLSYLVDCNEHPLLVVTCPLRSVPTIRAALTMNTLPPYFAHNAVYCLDVVRVQA